MKDVEHRRRLAQAEDFRRRATNFEALHELYLSDTVRAKLDDVRAISWKALIALRREDDSPLEHRNPGEKIDAMQAAVRALFEAMRQELQRGETDSGVQRRPGAAE